MIIMTFDDTLEHYGIKGMKWGVRRSKKEIAKSNAKRAKEGKPVTQSKDAKVARDLQKKAKTQGPDSLTDNELGFLNQRLNMEKQYTKLTDEPSTLDRGMKTAKTVLAVGATVNGAIAFAKSPAGQMVRKAVVGG